VAVSETDWSGGKSSEIEVRAAVEAAQCAAKRLRARSVEQVLAPLDRVIANWLHEDSKWQQRARQVLPAATGFSQEMIRHGLPLLLAPLRSAAVRALLDEELGDHRVLDAPQRNRCAMGPSLITHVLSGNIPGLAAAPIVLSLAVKSAALIKAAAGDPIFPALFAASVREIDAELAQCLVVTRWDGGDARFEGVAFAAADVVVASGSDAAIGAIAARVPRRFIGHGHKVSFAAIGCECLALPGAAARLARQLAYDVSLWDQHGCLSPQLCYVEAGAGMTPEDFASLLGDALAHFAKELPPRALSLEEKAAVLRFRQVSEWQETHRLLTSPDSTAWTISVEPNAEFVPSCLNRCIRLKVVRSLTDLATALAPHRRHLEAAGLAVGPERVNDVAAMLAAAGVHRICPVGMMQTPTLAWRQSGRPRVAEWVDWVGVEEVVRGSVGE
jgi:hypothetical protein